MKDIMERMIELSANEISDKIKCSQCDENVLTVWKKCSDDFMENGREHREA